MKLYSHPEDTCRIWKHQEALKRSKMGMCLNIPQLYLLQDDYKILFIKKKRKQLENFEIILN